MYSAKNMLGLAVLFVSASTANGESGDSQITITQAGAGFKWTMSADVAGVVAGTGDFPDISIALTGTLTSAKFTGSIGGTHNFLIKDAAGKDVAGAQTLGGAFDFDWTPSAAGIYTYYCGQHSSSMNGKITVTKPTVAKSEGSYTIEDMRAEMIEAKDYFKSYCNDSIVGSEPVKSFMTDYEKKTIISNMRSRCLKPGRNPTFGFLGIFPFLIAVDTTPLPTAPRISTGDRHGQEWRQIARETKNDDRAPPARHLKFLCSPRRGKEGRGEREEGGAPVAGAAIAVNCVTARNPNQTQQKSVPVSQRSSATETTAYSMPAQKNASCATPPSLETALPRPEQKLHRPPRWSHVRKHHGPDSTRSGRSC